MAEQRQPRHTVARDARRARAASSGFTARQARHAACCVAGVPKRKHSLEEAAPKGRLGGLGRAAGHGALPPPELSLMRAVLQDAIMCYLGRGKRRRVDPRILAREAEHWIRINDWESPFSFNNVCEALGLCHESTRRTILAWRNDPHVDERRAALS